MERHDRAKIAEFYDQSIGFYERFWHGDTNAVHLGFWDKDTQNLPEALINTNRFATKVAGIQTGDIILDAGCGVGGTAVWIARNIPDTKVVGITLSERQAKRAQELAHAEAVSHQAHFAVMDYLQMGFPDEAFNIVLAIESVLYASDKNDFLQEAFRVLKNEGRLVVADLFLKRTPQSRKEEHILQMFYDGFSVPNLATKDRFQESLDEVGFSDIRFWSKTDEVTPSFKLPSHAAGLIYPATRIIEKLPIYSNAGVRTISAGMSMYGLLANEVMEYGVFYSKKP